MKTGAAETRGYLDILESLIGFATVSRDPNRELLAYVEEWLGKHGVTPQILWNDDRRKGNLSPHCGRSDDLVAPHGDGPGLLASSYDPDA
jgi:hypothetical protein